MVTLFRSRRARALAACALSAALVSAGSAEALAASPTPTPKPSMSRVAASVTLKANSTTVNAGRSVRFTGRTTGIPTGTSVWLQQEKNGKWTTLKTSTKVEKGKSFLITTRPTGKGTHSYRVMVGKTHSDTVTVTVQ
jgi:hypothetical protein